MKTKKLFKYTNYSREKKPTLYKKNSPCNTLGKPRLSDNMWNTFRASISALSNLGRGFVVSHGCPAAFWRFVWHHSVIFWVLRVHWIGTRIYGASSQLAMWRCCFETYFRRAFQNTRAFLCDNWVVKWGPKCLKPSCAKVHYQGFSSVSKKIWASCSASKPEISVINILHEG